MNFDLNGLFNTVNGIVSNTATTIANVYNARAGLANLRAANAAATTPQSIIVQTPAPLQQNTGTIPQLYDVSKTDGSSNMLMIGGAVVLALVAFMFMRRGR